MWTLGYWLYKNVWLYNWGSKSIHLKGLSPRIPYGTNIVNLKTFNSHRTVTLPLVQNEIDVGASITIHVQRDSHTNHILIYPGQTHSINGGNLNEPLIITNDVAVTHCAFNSDNLWVCNKEGYDGGLRTTVVSTDVNQPVNDGLHLRHEMQTANVPNDFGVGIAFDLEDNSDNVKKQGSIFVSLADSTPNGENSEMTFQTRTTRNGEVASGLTDAMRLSSTKIYVPELAVDVISNVDNTKTCITPDHPHCKTPGTMTVPFYCEYFPVVYNEACTKQVVVDNIPKAIVKEPQEHGMKRIVKVHYTLLRKLLVT